ncbi:MAG: acyloxyacyl hydrolase [Bacteroidetes bacterium]|nr:acyloxyacyl hydrolase [Bacteroidota bacterium]
MNLRVQHIFSFLLTIVYWLLATFSFSQDTLPQKKLFINFSAHYGFIVAHHSNMNYLIKRHVPAGEFDLIRTTNGEKQWQRVYRNPEIGLGFFFAYLGNPEQLGEALGIFPFINFPLNPGRRVKLYCRVSDGLGLVTKPYNRIDNHKNNINGSYLNAFINLRLNSVFYPGKKIRMETGIGLEHLSNGALAMPNLGINLATINVGISFLKPQVTNLKSQKKQSPNPQLPTPKYFFTLTGAAGPNTINPPGGKEYAGFMFSASGWRNVTEKSRFGTGLETMYDFSNIEDAKRDSTFDTNKPLNNVQIGLKFGYELVIGKVGLPLEMGGYLISKTKSDNGPFYHRIGIRYYVNKHLIINYTLKTQWATAKNMEFGVGYRF